MSSLAQHCWNQIGVTGDNSCPQLATVVHCRNCSVYVGAGRELLQRPAPNGYLDEWTKLLARESLPSDRLPSVARTEDSPTEESVSLTIFRIGQEWLALPVWVIKEATQICPIHTLPHRTSHVFLGIVNIRGEILMCISLGDLLGLSSRDAPNDSNHPSRGYQRTIVLEIQENRWAFPVDEISSIQRFSSHEMKDPPVVVSKTPDTYTKKIITWQGRRINYIDYELMFYELLFYTLNRS